VATFSDLFARLDPETTMSDAWAIGAALRPVVALQESAKRFPHIKTGEDFTGYQKQR